MRLTRVVENTQIALLGYVEVVQAHNAVHPNRNVCGGVGGCNMMMTESELRDAIRDGLDELAASGEGFTLRVVRR